MKNSLYNSITKAIRKGLSESLLDDDFFEDPGIDTLRVSDKIDVKKIFGNKFGNDLTGGKTGVELLIGFISKYDSWVELRDATYDYFENTNKIMSIGYIKMSVYFDTIDPVKYVFDKFLEYDIKVSIQYLELLLDNTKDVYYTISDVIDFERYKDVLYLFTFGITHGKLNNLIGVPSYIKEGIIFSYVTDIKNMEGFPDEGIPLELTFDTSPFPESWKGIPTVINNIRFECPKIERVAAKTYTEDLPIFKEYIRMYFKLFKDIPNDLTFKKNPLRTQGVNFVGCCIVDPNWGTAARKYAREYISICLKAQYKNISKLKNSLCKLWSEM